MYLDYIFLLTDFYKNDYIPDTFESGTFIIPLHPQLWEDKTYYIQKLDATYFTFCFGCFEDLADWENLHLSSIRDAASLFFFLPNYIKKAGTYLLTSDRVTRKGREQMEEIEKLLQTQGITPLSKDYISKEDQVYTFNKYCYYNNDFIAAFEKELSDIDFSLLFKTMVAEKGAYKQIVLPVKDEADFERKKSIIATFDQWLLSNEKAYIDLLSMFKNVNDDHLKMEIDNKKLRFRIDNYNDYLKLLRELAILHVNEYQRIHHEQQVMMKQYGISMPANSSGHPPMIYSSDEALQKELEYLRSNREDILRWYEKEYEVLPLWYKRFGHIVKVMMGKRSLKSLYK